MKLVCQYGNLATKGSYWCRDCDHACPPNQLSLVFDSGELFGDFVILNRIHVFPSATLYRAQRSRSTVLVKIAHKGYEEQLKQEAVALARIGFVPGLLQLLSATQSEQRAYGKFAVQDETKYYVVYKDISGEPLRNILKVRSQPALSYVAQVVFELARTLDLLHLKYRKLLLNISPDTILIQTDKSGTPHATLVDFGMLTDLGESAKSLIGPSAYFPPELLQAERCSPASDVYELGLLTYEMLAGQPVFSSKLRHDEDVRRLVLTQLPSPLEQIRPDLNRFLVDPVMQSLEKQPALRQPTIRGFIEDLRPVFGTILVEPHRFGFTKRAFVLAVTAAIVMLIVTLVMLLV